MSSITSETLIWLSLLIPSVGAFFIWVSSKSDNLRETMTFATALSLFIVVITLLIHVLEGQRPEFTLLEMLPGLSIRFVIEPLGMIFASIAAILWPINSLYSIGYMRGNNEKHQTRFYIFFAIAIAAAMGIAFAGNLITLFVFYEVLTLSTYPLVTHKGNADAKKGGRIYLGILIATSIGLLLPAIIWTSLIAGTTEFPLSVNGSGMIGDRLHGAMLGVLLFLYMYGIGKAALMPIHKWLPSAMVAPTPVSALLHAVAVVKAGVFSVLKVIVYVFGIDTLSEADYTDWLLYIAGFTIIVASLIALQQDNLKRRLAYSTISQLSYVILGAAILAPISAVGAALHIAAHAFGKITLFFAAGSIYTAAHKTEISQLDGIGRRMPWTMGAFAIGAISMIGVPPAAGFLSKWYMLLGAFNTEQFIAVAVIIISTLLNAAYFIPVIYRAFFKAEKIHDDGHHHEHGEAPWPIVVALTMTASLTILLFFFHQIPLDLANKMIGR